LEMAELPLFGRIISESSELNQRWSSEVTGYGSVCKQYKSQRRIRKDGGISLEISRYREEKILKRVN
jgi:hypothetical protein